MNEHALRFRLGVFVLAALICLAVLITLFGGFPNYFQEGNTYTLVFTNAQGVSRGTPVRRSGVRIGEVRSINLDNDTGKVLVLIQIDKGFTLRKGDRPTLAAGFLGGDSSIAFLPPPVEEGKVRDVTPVEPGSTLVGAAQADPGSLLQKAADIVPPAQDTLLEMQKLIQKFDKMTPILEDTLKEFREVVRGTREMVPEIREVVKVTRDTIPEFREVAKAARDLMPEVKNIFKQTGDLIPEIREVAKAAREAIPEFRDLAKAGREFIPDIKKTNDSINDLAKTTRDTIRDVVPELKNELKKVTDEVQVTTRTWGKVGERVDLMIQTNEKKVSETLDRLADSIRGLNSLFSEENQRYFRETIKNVRDGTQNIDGIAKETESLLKETRITIKQLADSLTKIDAVVFDMQKLTKPLAERGDSVFKNLDETTDKLNRMLGDLRDVFSTVVRTDGTVQKLLTDPAIFNKIDEALTAVNRTIPRLDHILRDVEIFADRIARHPESLGVGGALRPSTGLKEPPSGIRVLP